MAEARHLPAARHEPRDVGERAIWVAFVLLSALLVLTVLLTWWLYPQSLLDRTITPPLPLYPEPRLQTDPSADLERFQTREQQWLHSAGWLDREHTRAHISIDAAMADVAREGLPGWPP